MMQLIQTFGTETTHQAAEAATSKGFFEVLGIDGRSLVLQLLAFIVLVWVLKKFVYPPLVASIDKREKAIEHTLAAATKAEEQAEQTQNEINDLFAKARAEASEIVDLAHKEATNMVKDAEDKAKTRAEQIVTDARAQLDADVLKARKMLKQEAVHLVAAATEKVVGAKLNDTADKQRIASALAEGERA